jgi:hypothetical protein
MTVLVTVLMSLVMLVKLEVQFNLHFVAEKNFPPIAFFFLKYCGSSQVTYLTSEFSKLKIILFIHR